MSLPFLSVAVVLPLLLNAQEEKLHGTSGGDALKMSDFEVPFLARGQPDDDLMAPGARAAKESSKHELEQFWTDFEAGKPSDDRVVPIVSVDSVVDRPMRLPDVYFERPNGAQSNPVFKRAGFQFQGARGKKSNFPLAMNDFGAPLEKRFSYLPSRGRR
ncbi:hypothetical protein AAVH_03176 [Aphelenchoides avenae]|nr:hypothetical protein AAVH_03176 [Aphelenchus avenae]